MEVVDGVLPTIRRGGNTVNESKKLKKIAEAFAKLLEPQPRITERQEALEPERFSYFKDLGHTAVNSSL